MKPKRPERADLDQIILRSIADAVLATDALGSVILLNPAAESLLGVKEGETRGEKAETLFTLLDPKSRRPLENPVARVLSEASIVAIPLGTVLLSRQGSEQPISGEAAPILDQGGAVLGCAAIFRDRSDRMRAYHEAERTAERLRSMEEIFAHEAPSSQEFLDFALEKAISLTASKIGYIYFYDDTARRFTLNTWSRGVMEACSVANPATVYDLDKTGAWGEAVRQARPIIMNDFAAPDRMKRGYPEGHTPLRKFMTIPVFHAGRIVAVVGVANKESDYDEADVLQLRLLMDSVWKAADRRRAEEALARSEAALKESQRVAGLGHYSMDVKKGVWTNSEAMDAVFGIDADYRRDVAGWLGLVHPEEQEEMAAYLSGPVLRDKLPFNKEYRIVRPLDGAVRWVHGRGELELDASGEAAVMFGTIQDVTSRKRAEEDGEKLRTQLIQAQKMESVGRLAGGVAHDFNNMLGAIMGHAELALDGLAPGDPARAHLAEILNASRRSADLTRQLLAFARKQTVSPKPLDLNAAIESMLKMLARMIGENIALSWEPGAGLWAVMIDPSQVDQILANLCVNARDAIKGQGRVSIRTANASAPGEGGCSDCPPGDYVMVAVGDDGQGMSDEVRRHIFEPFFTTKSVGQGTGLGLATVYGIVKQNDGYIEVRSGEGAGTTIFIYMPRYRGPVQAERAADDDGADPGKGETVLLVEDEAMMRELVRDMLVRLGYDVLAADSPAQALKLAAAEEKRISLLLSDVIMPGMNGRELSELLREMMPGLPSLFMSGYTADVIAHQGILEEGFRFLQKPFAITDLSKAIRRALDEK
jgi:PAS domain S-box-containing protein